MIQFSYGEAFVVFFDSMFFGACITVLARFIERMFLPYDDRHEYTQKLVEVSDAAMNVMDDFRECSQGQHEAVSHESAKTLRDSINHLAHFEATHSICDRYLG